MAGAVPVLTATAVATRPRPTGGLTVPIRLRSRTAEEDADRILDATWRVAGRGLPVDPFRIADRLGIDVLESDLGPAFGAALVKDHGHDPKIVLNSADHRTRQRVACAHALGHFAERRADPDEYTYVDSRDIFAGDTADAAERYATEFAAALLMPADYVRLLHAEGWTELDMPVRFAVSRDALHYRLKQLGLG